MDFDLAQIYKVESGSWFSKRKTTLAITDKYCLITREDKSQQTKLFSEIVGITKSLRSGCNNFLVHFRGLPDEEWQTSQREIIIRELQRRYKKAESQSL